MQTRALLWISSDLVRDGSDASANEAIKTVTTK